VAEGLPQPQYLHASAVAFGVAGLLIVGPSGSGKSSLALQLMALGAVLVADDRVLVTPLADGALRLSAPGAVAGLIEARGVGLIRVEHAPAIARAVVDLETVESERLPPLREIVIAGHPLPCLRRVESSAFPSMLIAYLKGDRAAP
jgi:HPr kinase/phosphorylase